MGLIACLETSLRNYYYSLRNNKEERSSLLVLKQKVVAISYRIFNF
jgi:hypothetical protein